MTITLHEKGLTFGDDGEAFFFEMGCLTEMESGELWQEATILPNDTPEWNIRQRVEGDDFQRFASGDGASPLYVKLVRQAATEKIGGQQFMLGNGANKIGDRSRRGQKHFALCAEEANLIFFNIDNHILFEIHIASDMSVDHQKHFILEQKV